MNISAIFTIAGWAMLIGLGLYVFYVLSMRSQRRPAKLSALVLALLLIGGIALLTLGAGLVFIDQTEAGVVISPLTQGGVRPSPLLPGIHFVIPFVEYVERFRTDQQAYTMSGKINEGAVVGNDAVEALTSDAQKVYIDATVRFHADPVEAVKLRGLWLTEGRYIEGFVRPTSRSAIYNTTSRYRVEEIYALRRTELQASVEAALIEQFRQQGLVLDAFQLRNIEFSPEFQQSVEQKQIAQQQAEQAKLLVQKSQQEADQLRAKVKGEADAVILRANGDAEAAVTRAKGDAEALKLIAEALQTNQDLLTYTYIQKLAPNVGVIMLPSSNGSTPYMLNLSDLLNQARPPSVLPTPTATQPFTTTTTTP